MKSWMLLLPAVHALLPAGAQNAAETYLLAPVHKPYHYRYVEVAGASATVFHLGAWVDKGGSGFRLYAMDAIAHRPDPGGAATVVQEGERVYLNYRESGKWKRLRMDTTVNEKEVYRKINNGYWWSRFPALAAEIGPLFPWIYFTWRNGFALWDSLPAKDLYYKDFQPYADRRLKEIRDSIIATQTPPTRLTQYLIQNIPAMEYAAIRDSFLLLPPYDYGRSRYMETVADQICLHRPELFFRLAEDLPYRRHELFSAVTKIGQTIKNLRAVQTGSPLKKQFLQWARTN